jgi:hypothetical protein
VREAQLGRLAPVVIDAAHAEACGIDVSRDYVAIRADTAAPAQHGSI